METLTIIELILTIVLLIVAYDIRKILKQCLNELKSIENDKPKEFKRNHFTISQSNFGSILNGRTNVYDKYKNESGLYEPVQGKAGINLNQGNKGE